MGLIPVPEPTAEEIAKEQAVMLGAWIDGTLLHAKERTRTMFDLFWNNEKATPMQMSAVFGANAAILFQKLAIWQEAIKQIDDSYEVLEVPEQYTYTINEDGTVTISETESE